MPDKKSGRWLKWFGAAAPEAPRTEPDQPGKERTFDVEEALARLEGRVCEGVVAPDGGLAGLRDGVLNAFGRPVTVRGTIGAPARVSIGTGLALCGIRTAVFVRTGGLIAAHGSLVAATERMAPLVFYRIATGDGPSPASLLTVIGAGLFQVAARNGTHALDLALVVRRTTERSLVPGLLRAHDAGPEELRFPPDALIREYLGAPGDICPCPTEAQRVLFGPDRRRMVRWFDPDHPVVLGGDTLPQDVARARVARELYFQSHVREIAEEAMVDLSARVGRHIGFIEPFGVDDAEVVVVAAGGAADAAWSAARQIRKERGVRAGVVALTWLRPFPEVQLAAVLRGKQRVAVLEPAGDPLSSQGPLTREVAAAVPELAGRLVTATCWREVPTEDGIVDLFAALAGGDLPHRLRLDSLVPPIPTGLPRVDAMLQALDSAYPRLSGEALVGRAPLPSSLVRGGSDPDDLPAVIRRIGAERQAPDSLPRFWGEVIQPALAGVHTPPEPRTATGAVPGGATALLARHSEPRLPVLDPAACTGCGRCWSFCPDSAIGVAALGVEPLLSAASRIAGTQGRGADALRRAHRHLAARVATLLDADGEPRLDAALLQDAWTWFAGKGAIPEEERPEWEAAWQATAAVVADLAPAVTDPLYRKDEGPGELLVLAFDPRACQACDLCVASCEADALSLPELDDGGRADAARRWRAWEQLPDTSGETIARASGLPQPGPMASLLMSRHAAMAQAGAPDEPGSIQRLALRLLSAVAERRGQVRLAQEIESLDDVARKLDARLHSLVGDSLAEAGAGTIAEAVGKVMTERASLGELAAHLAEQDVAVQVDRASLLNTSRTAVEVGDLRERLAKGADGLGRARFGVVVGAGAPASLTRFPLHPWFAPAAVELGDGAGRLALGLASGLAADHLAVVRLLKRAALHVAPPSDLKVRIAELARLRWSDLGDDEKAGCAPLLLLTDVSTWSDRAQAALEPLLASDLPIKVVVLDGLDRPTSTAPTLAAVAHRVACVAACSPAFPDHMARCIEDALSFPGPALIHLQAPPPRHGATTVSGLDLARMAVECRAHVLLRFDPREGVGRGDLDLSCNPEPQADLGGCSLGDWAAAQERFADLFQPLEEDEEGVPFDRAVRHADLGGRRPMVTWQGRRLAARPVLMQAARRRLDVWDAFRELAGVAGPLADRIRRDVTAEIQVAHAAEAEAGQAGRAVEIAAAVEREDARLSSALTERLLELAGYPVASRGEG